MTLLEELTICRACPRQCGVNRVRGELGFCRTDHRIHLSWAGLHLGEEPCFSGAKGVGNLFFSSCNMACVYCQNHQISQEGMADRAVSVEEFVAAALDLQAQGASFLGLVSPSHQVLQIREGVIAAKKAGMTLPVLYNSSAYDSVEMLRTLEGLVDAYLPDLKYSSEAMARRYSNAPGYVEASRAAILEMHRQVGDIRIDESTGMALRGVWTRLLVLPGNAAGLWESLCFLALEASPRIGVSIMAQYSPLFKAGEHPEIGRKLTAEEYGEALSMARDLGFEHILSQDMESSPENATPDFTDPERPFRSF